MSMRGIYTSVTKIRRQVFTEVAKFAYEGSDYSKLEELPYEIITGEVPIYRDSVFKERAIVGERIRLAMGLPLRPVDQNAPISKGIDENSLNKHVEPPLVNVISFACDACEPKAYFVTDNCRGCLAHPCSVVCPVKAISFEDGRAVIDKQKCLKCGRCKEACPYSAIVFYDRPCAQACGVDAIESDSLGRAKINYDKCVSCGMCIVSCPFGAIADKSQIYQLIQSIQKGDEVVAEIAPAFVGQFGPMATPDKLKAALKELGFADVMEVAVGADVGAAQEAHHFLQAVPDEQPLLATSCCPSWSVMAKAKFPELADSMSKALTPMVATARIIKKEKPNAKVCFIGPCASKKLEASRKSVRSDVDFVVTFEELMGMFIAKNIDFQAGDATESINDATASGRGYAVSGGVAQAIVDCIHAIDPDREVPIDSAQGLRECAKMLALAKAGKRRGYIIEGMACPGGCVAGAGTLQPIQKAMAAVKGFAKQAEFEVSVKSPKVEHYKDIIID